MAKNRICKCCKKEYEYCPVCKEYSTLPRWMTEFDTEKCKEVFNIVSAYNMGLADKEKVKLVLDRYNITDYNCFKESITNKLNEIFKESEINDHTDFVPNNVENDEDHYMSLRRKTRRKSYVEEANTEE